MKSVYNGFWLPGETGFTGSSWIKGYSIQESKTLFTLSNYKSYGLQHHVPNKNQYNLLAVNLILNYFTIVVTNDKTDPIQLKPYELALVNNPDYRTYTEYNGKYIGNLKDALYLINRGIYKPQTIDNNQVCSYGYSTIDHKWYGWSHRAIYGFELGSKVSQGDCAYVPNDPKEIIKELELQNQGHLGFSCCLTGECDCLDTKSQLRYSPDYTNIRYDEKTNSVVYDYPVYDHNGKLIEYNTESIELGKGEWIAKSDSDCQQMAIDFAKSVS